MYIKVFAKHEPIRRVFMKAIRLAVMDGWVPQGAVSFVESVPHLRWERKDAVTGKLSRFVEIYDDVPFRIGLRDESALRKQRKQSFRQDAVEFP